MNFLQFERNRDSVAVTVEKIWLYEETGHFYSDQELARRISISY